MKNKKDILELPFWTFWNEMRYLQNDDPELFMEIEKEIIKPHPEN